MKGKCISKNCKHKKCLHYEKHELNLTCFGKCIFNKKFIGCKITKQ
jgi:hypothetical protein